MRSKRSVQASQALKCHCQQRQQEYLQTLFIVTVLHKGQPLVELQALLHHLPAAFSSLACIYFLCYAVSVTNTSSTRDGILGEAGDPTTMGCADIACGLQQLPPATGGNHR